LSQFAGAAEELAEALIVNPYDVDGMADAVHTALQMSRTERRERHKALLKRIRRQDAKAWLSGFIRDLETGSVEDGDVGFSPAAAATETASAA
jgi:trehalose 6-phosphate synthase